MKIIFRKRKGCKASIFRHHEKSVKKNLFYFLRLFTKINPIWFIYGKTNCANFKYSHLSIDILRRWILTFELNAWYYELDKIKPITYKTPEIK